MKVSLAGWNINDILDNALIVTTELVTKCRKSGRGLPDSKLDDERLMAEDAIRLYAQGWSIQQVAKRFECSDDVMRRILREHRPA